MDGLIVSEGININMKYALRNNSVSSFDVVLLQTPYVVLSDIRLTKCESGALKSLN